MAPDSASEQPTRPTAEIAPPQTAARRERLLRFVGLIMAALALVWLATAAVSISSAEVKPGETATGLGDAWGYDFEAYANAAMRLSAEGSLYQAETLDGPFRPGPYGLYMYSPTLGVALLPVADIALADSSMLWYAAHVLALLAAMALMPVRLSIRIWAFVIAALSLAIIRDSVLGNVSVPLLLPLAAAWRWLDRPLGSVAQAVAISIRPMLGILIVWQLLRRRWLAVAWTLAAGVVLILVTLPFVGIDGYFDYLAVLRNLADVTGVEHNVDLGSTALTFGADADIATVALITGYAIAIGAVLLSLRRDREVGFMVTLGASLLLSPLLWDHYLAMLILPAAFLAQRGRPWALALPLLSWLPAEALPFVVVVATLLPFIARAPAPAGSTPDATSDLGPNAGPRGATARHQTV
jgi:hypothetical protein